MTHRDDEINGFAAAYLIRWVGFFEISCWEDRGVSSQRALGGPEAQFNRSCTHKCRYFSLCDHWKYWWPLTLRMNGGSRSVRSKTKPAVKIVTKGDNLSGLRFSVECEKWARQRETCRASSRPLLSNKNWNDEGSVFVKTLFF